MSRECQQGAVLMVIKNKCVDLCSRQSVIWILMDSAVSHFINIIIRIIIFWWVNRQPEAFVQNKQELNFSLSPSEFVYSLSNRICGEVRRKSSINHSSMQLSPSSCKKHKIKSGETTKWAILGLWFASGCRALSQHLSHFRMSDWLVGSLKETNGPSVI